MKKEASEHLPDGVVANCWSFEGGLKGWCYVCDDRGSEDIHHLHAFFVYSRPESSAYDFYHGEGMRSASGRHGWEWKLDEGCRLSPRDADAFKLQKEDPDKYQSFMEGIEMAGFAEHETADEAEWSIAEKDIAMAHSAVTRCRVLLGVDFPHKHKHKSDH